MRVTITIDDVQDVHEILDVIKKAYSGYHLVDGDGELYKGHRQFEVLGYNMMYTGEETTD